MKFLTPSFALCCLAGGLSAQIVTPETFSFNNVNQNVPDANEAGISDSRTIDSAIDSIGDLNVTLNLAGRGGGAFNGDLYVTLTHNSGYSVLLNRPGRRSGSTVGYGDNGLDVTFDDAAANGDIHTYRLTLNGSNTTPLNTPPLTGIWSPDGRGIDPDLVLNTDPRDQLLGSFSGLNADGVWTLFVADLETGGAARLVSWGLAITPVPEPGQYAAIAALGLFGFAAWSRCRRCANK
jgi:subtilisin-like proprotein convertase family protein